MCSDCQAAALHHSSQLLGKPDALPREAAFDHARVCRVKEVDADGDREQPQLVLKLFHSPDQDAFQFELNVMNMLQHDCCFPSVHDRSPLVRGDYDSEETFIVTRSASSPLHGCERYILPACVLIRICVISKRLFPKLEAGSCLRCESAE